MPSSYDRLQDTRLDLLESDVANLRKRITANVRKMKQISDDLNARLDALEQSGQHAPAPAKPQTRRQPKGVKPK